MKSKTLSCISTTLVLLSLIPSNANSVGSQQRDYTFKRSISRLVLENYLSRAITMSDLFMGEGALKDNIRMLTNVGAKFAGRTVFVWGKESRLPALLSHVPADVAKLHAADPEMILQAGVFEIITTDVENLPIPDWVFQEFGLPVESRNFDYEAMLFDSGDEIDFYGPGASVPDITKLETKLWFFYAAASYMDINIEAIHLGQS